MPVVRRTAYAQLLAFDAMTPSGTTKAILNRWNALIATCGPLGTADEVSEALFGIERPICLCWDMAEGLYHLAGRECS
jgi:hypothetical protein